MPKEFRFPDLGEGVAEGELVKWLVREGDRVKEDQDVAEVETDKALVNIPSPYAGIVEKLHYKEGEKIPVGSTLLSFKDEGSIAPSEPSQTAPETKSQPPQPTSQLDQIAPQANSKVPPATIPQPEAKLPVLATPHTRKLARDMGLDIETIRGSGENGRITEDDLRRAASSAGQKAESLPISAAKVSAPLPGAADSGTDDFEKYGSVKRVPVKGIRRKISENMLKAAQQTVMVTHIDEAEVDALIQLRHEKKTYAEKRGVKLTMLPFLMKACVIALKNYPYLNASLIDDEIVLKDYFHFGFAVDTDSGLMVPVIRDVDQKSIMRLATELATLSEQARNRSISLEALKGHSFSITNIGSIGGRAFTPILHYPDSAILGLGRTYQKPVVRNGEVKVASVLPLCLTFDHRVTDGATAARFTNDVVKYLGDPDLLLLDDGD